MNKKEPQIIPVQYIPINQCKEDEIDLKELIKTILKYKKFIIIFTLTVTFIAGLYAFLKTPIWEIKSNIQIGYINNSNSNSKIYTLNPYATKIFIKNNFDYSDTTQHYPKIDINFVKDTKDILSITIDDLSNEKAINYLNKILSIIKQQENKKIKSYIDSINSQIKILKQNKQNIILQIKRLNQNLKHERNPQIYANLLDALPNYQNQLIQFDLQITKLQSQISSLNINKTKIIGKIKTQNHPIKPKKKLIIIVAFITAFILSIFLVFFIEFVKGFEEE